MRAIIVDDEQTVWTQLKNLLAKHCKQVELIGEASNAHRGDLLMETAGRNLPYLH